MHEIFSFYFFLVPVFSLVEYYEGSYSKVSKEKMLPITYRLKILYPINDTSSRYSKTIKAVFSYIEPPTSSIPDEPFSTIGTYVESADLFFIFYTKEPFVQIQKNSLTYQEQIGKFIYEHSNLTLEQQVQYHNKVKELLRNQSTPKNYMTYIYRRNCSNITKICYLYGTQCNQASRLLYTSMRTYNYIKLDRDWRLFVSLYGLVIALKSFIWLIVPKTQPSLVCSAFIQYYCMSEFSTSLLFFSTRKYFDITNTTVFTVILVYSLFITFYYGSSMAMKSENIEHQDDTMRWIMILSNFRYFYFFNIFSFFFDFPAYSLFLMFSFMVPQIVFSAIYNKKKTIGIIFTSSLVFAQLCSVYLIVEYYPNSDHYFKDSKSSNIIKMPAIWASLQLIVIFLQRIFGGAFFIPKKSRRVQFSYTAEKPPPDSECAICLCNIAENEEYYSTPCHHYFHRQCLARWMEENTICPICRAPLPTIEE